MIAVAVTLTFALYVFGPDAFSRFVIGFTLPRRAVLLTRSEEVYRALLWSATSFFVAYAWMHVDGTWSERWHPAALKTCFTGLYSESFFRENRDLWFNSVKDVFSLNLSLLSRLYLAVLFMSVALTVLTHFYGVVRDWLPDWTWLKNAFAAFVLPRVAQWHVYLSKLLLGDRSLSINLDVLTKSDKLYQGELSDKALAADGSLVSITLISPRRFDREAYLEAKKTGDAEDTDLFWRVIPTNLFVILAADIGTINLRHLPRNRSLRPLRSGSPELSDLLRTIAEQVDAARRQIQDQNQHQQQGSDV